MDNIVHPQKRMDIQRVLEMVIFRLIVLKHLLVKWNPPYPPLGRGPFPYDNLNLDDVLVDLKLPASVLEIRIPRYFVEDRQKLINERNQLVNGYYNLHHGTQPPILQVDLLKFVSETLPMKLEDAISLLQKNERGRQGMKRAELMKKLLKDEDNKNQFGVGKPDADPEVAALDIQRVYRSHAARKKIREEEYKELEYIGMRKPPDNRKKTLIKETKNANRKRIVLQNMHQANYENSLNEIKQKVKDDEGPEMREKFLDERREWFLKQLETGVTPNDLSTFYNPPPPPDPDAEDKKKKAKKEAAKKPPPKKEPPKKAPAKKGKEEEPPPEMPKYLSEVAVTKDINDMAEKYHNEWENDEREKENFEQEYDIERAKNVVRPTVEEEVREQVDQLMLLQLANIKCVLDSKKKKKKKKGKKKKAKKPKKPKGKKLPGAKYCKNMEVDQMLSILVEKKIIINYEKHKMSEFLGEMNYLGTMYQTSGLTEPDKNGDPRLCALEPTLANIRQNLREYATLPLGCQPVKDKLDPEYNIKSIFLYGPHGSGKTMLAQAIATETGAMMMDLSYEKLSTAFPGKNGILKVLHMIFQVGREPKWGPTVLYMEGIETLYGPAKGKKKKQKNAEKRIKTGLIKYLKTLDPGEQVILIGTALQPWIIPEKSIKALKNLFQKSFYCPFPDYPSMVEIWREMIEKKLNKNLPKRFTVSNLAKISTGYTAGAIQYAVDITLTERRIYHVFYIYYNRLKQDHY